MRQSTRLILNSLVSMASGIISLALQLVLVPVITHYIGKAAYGVYVIVAGLTYYTPFLHMGMSSSMTRYGAAHLAKEEYEELNATVNTVVAYYRIVALIFFAVACTVAWFLTDVFRIQPDLQYAARWCVVIVGACEATSLWLGPVGSLLWSIERYDLYTIPVTLFRFIRLLAMIVVLPWVSTVTGLVCVTVIMTLTNFIPVVIQRGLAIRYTPRLTINMRLAKKRLLLPMIRFGVTTLLWQWSHTMLDYVTFVLIGHYLSTVEVAEYQIPCFMLLSVSMLVETSTMVTEPTASKLLVTNRMEELRNMLLRATKYAAGISMSGCAALGLLAPTVLHLWVGDQFIHVAGVLGILTIGKSIFFVHTTTYHTMTGMGKQFIPGILSVITMAVVALSQAILLSTTSWGLPGVAAATSVGILIGYGLAIPIYACRQIGVGLWSYFRMTLVRPLIASIPGIALWTAIRPLQTTHIWICLAIGLVGGAIVVLTSWWFILFDPWDRDLAREKILALWSKVRSRFGAQTV